MRSCVRSRRRHPRVDVKACSSYCRIEGLSVQMARGSQGIGRLLVVFRSISDAASVLGDVDVIVDEASTAFNATLDSEPMFSAWERITKASTCYGPPRNSESTIDLRLAGSSARL